MAYEFLIDPAEAFHERTPRMLNTGMIRTRRCRALAKGGRPPGQGDGDA